MVDITILRRELATLEAPPPPPPPKPTVPPRNREAERAFALYLKREVASREDVRLIAKSVALAEVPGIRKIGRRQGVHLGHSIYIDAYGLKVSTSSGLRSIKTSHMPRVESADVARASVEKGLEALRNDGVGPHLTWVDTLRDKVMDKGGRALLVLTAPLTVPAFLIYKLFERVDR